MARERLKAAVVGLGKMGLLHASILNILHNVELRALCEKSSIIRKFSKKMFEEVHVVDDVEKLSNQNLDLFYVTTPIFFHSPVIMDLYSREMPRNIFVEKTLASSYDEAKELCESAERFGGINMVGYMKRFTVTFKKAKDLLTQKTLGELISFEAYAYSSDFLGSNNPKNSASRGGPLKDLGCHVIDLALWFFGDLQLDLAELQAQVEGNSENPVCFGVSTSDDVKGRLEVSRCMKGYRLPEVGLSIKGSDGVMIVNDDKVELRLDDGKSFTWYRHDLNDNVSFWLGASEYVREDEYFVESILKQQSAEPSFHTALKVDYIIDQVISGAEKHA